MNLFGRYFDYYSREQMKEWSSLRKSGYLLLPLLIYFAVHDISEILLWALLNQIMLQSSQGVLQWMEENAYTIKGMINGLAILLGVAVIGKPVGNEIQAFFGEIRARTKKIRAEQEKDKSKKITDYVILCVIAFSAAVGINLLFDLIGFTGSSTAYTQTSQMQYDVSFVIGLALYGVISPFAEEAVFRGLIYNRMKRCFNYGIALIVSSLLFGCYHGNVVQAVYGTLLGLLIAIIYELYQSFAAPVLFHSIANVSIFAFTYHNNLSRMQLPAQIIVSAGTLLAAGIGMIYIIKRYKNEEKTDDLT